ncbi:hypothetical protein KIPE111705_45975 [Kibdelosporangium persicum]
MSGPDAHVIPGVPGRWSTTEAGALTVTAAAGDGVKVNGETADGTVEVPSGSTLEFPGGQVGFAGGTGGAYGVPSCLHLPPAPPGNHLPMRIEAGERALVHTALQDKAITYLRYLENRDWASARTMCSDTATVWHNDGKGDETIDQNISGMRGQIDAIESMRYEIVRQFTKADEVLQQHVVHVATKDGTRGQVHAAVYFRFEDGLISRIEEYANFVPSA